jgi:membrane protease YdiL (CAAX protease family)
MVTQASNQILADLANWSVAALLLGLVVYGLWRRLSPATAPAPVGRVSASHACDVLDAVVALVMVLLLRQLLVDTAAAAPGSIDSSDPLGGRELLIGLILSVLLGGSVAFYLGVLRHRNLSEWFGLGRSRPLVTILKSILFLIASFLAVFVTGSAVSRKWLEPLGFEDAPQEIVRAFSDSPNPIFRVLVAIMACAVAPVVEEVVFRGFLYPVFKRFTDAPFAALFTAILFGLVHQNLGGVLPLASLGLILVIAYESTGSLAVPMTIHALFNAAAIGSLWVLNSHAAP